MPWQGLHPSPQLVRGEQAVLGQHHQQPVGLGEEEVVEEEEEEEVEEEEALGQ